MSHVVILAGPPGSGKTHYRRQELGDAPGVDVADIYKFHNDRWPDVPMNWEMAHGKMHRQLVELTREYELVWVEAMFVEGSPSLKALLDVLKAEGASWEIVRMDTPLEECFARVEEDFLTGRTCAAQTRKRNKLLRKLAKERRCSQ